MTEQYVVKFFKNLVSSDGHPFKVLQRAIDVRRSKSQDRAIEAAQHRFKRAKHVSDWKIHADSMEAEIKDTKATKGPVGKARG
jgi:hypothetical protein